MDGALRCPLAVARRTTRARPTVLQTSCALLCVCSLCLALATLTLSCCTLSQCRTPAAARHCTRRQPRPAGLQLHQLLRPQLCLLRRKALRGLRVRPARGRVLTGHGRVLVALRAARSAHGRRRVACVYGRCAAEHLPEARRHQGGDELGPRGGLCALGRRSEGSRQPALISCVAERAHRFRVYSRDIQF